VTPAKFLAPEEPPVVVFAPPPLSSDPPHAESSAAVPNEAAAPSLNKCRRVIALRVISSKTGSFVPTVFSLHLDLE
jgi:hypothetical protein